MNKIGNAFLAVGIGASTFLWWCDTRTSQKNLVENLTSIWESSLPIEQKLINSTNTLGSEDISRKHERFEFKNLPEFIKNKIPTFSTHPNHNLWIVRQKSSIEKDNTEGIIAFVDIPKAAGNPIFGIVSKPHQKVILYSRYNKEFSTTCIFMYENGKLIWIAWKQWKFAREDIVNNKNLWLGN